MAPMAEGKPSGCVDFWQQATRTVAADVQTGDILFLPSLRQHRFSEVATKSDHTLEATQEAAVWLRPFVDRRMKIVFEAPKPIFRSPPFRCSDWFNSHNPVCEGGFAQSRSDLQNRRAGILLAMNEIAGEEPTVSVWDPFPILCPEAVCQAFSERRPLFFDFDHLSAYGNAVLYPSFKAAIVAATARNQL
jgi:hypothetical protein